MCLNYDEMWQDYLDRLSAAGVDRDTSMVKDSGHSCSSH
jgi:DUF971 family protein